MLTTTSRPQVTQVLIGYRVPPVVIAPTYTPTPYEPTYHYQTPLETIEHVEYESALDYDREHPTTCYSTTAASPMLGPCLHRSQLTPEARLLIGYRWDMSAYGGRLFDYTDNYSMYHHRWEFRREGDEVEIIKKLDHRTVAETDRDTRHLGNALLLDRITTGGNQNEYFTAVPLMNRRCMELQQAVNRGAMFDVLI
jgi:hypothetical protein